MTPTSPDPTPSSVRTPEQWVVLIVDDVPENLSLLHDMLDGSGYRVLVATDGASAIERARELAPHVILLDAVMPGLDGFATCRRLKADIRTRAIPVIFMTGLTDSEHVVRGFEAGGVDYVTKPVRPEEVLARIAAHLRNSQMMEQTRQAIDAAGQAVVALDSHGQVLWLTPLASRLLQPWLDEDGTLPSIIHNWLVAAAHSQSTDPGEPLLLHHGRSPLTLSRLPDKSEGQTLVLLQPQQAVPEPEILMRACKITLREAEVLYWVTQGKTNRDIGDILGTSPRTINKHLEHVFTKLGVETRTSAAALALSKGRGWRPGQS